MLILLPIIATLAGAFVGGIFSLFTLKRRLREETRLLHMRRQIEELYGPLQGLIQYGAAINEIELVRLPANARDESGKPRDEEGGRVIRFFREHYYLPLNMQMVELIRTKIYLLDSDVIPSSFTDFIRHAAQLDAFHRLWKEANISTHGIKPIKYPPAFKSDVETTLNTLRRRYNAYTGGSKDISRPTHRFP